MEVVRWGGGEVEVGGCEVEVGGCEVGRWRL